MLLVDAKLRFPAHGLTQAVDLWFREHHLRRQ